TESDNPEDHEREYHGETKSHLPVEVHHQQEKHDQRESFLEKIGEIFRQRDPGLFDVVDYRRQEPPGWMMLEKSDWLAEDFGEDAIAQVGCCGVADILNLRGAQVLRDALGNKNYEQRNAENRPDVMKVGWRKELIQVDYAATRQRQQRQL